MWTKGVAAGVLGLVAVGLLVGLRFGALGNIAAPAVALALSAATGILLVWDLKQPLRFFYIFSRPNPTSWLVWGAVALTAFSAVAVCWLIGGSAGFGGVVSGLRLPAVVGAVLAAGYTGFLFAQAEGRDLWQSPLLFWHLLAQAGLTGGGALLILAPWLDVPADAERFLVRCVAVAAVVHLAALVVEYSRRHPTGNAELAARLMVRGAHAPLFWAGVVGSGVVAGLAISQWSASWPLAGVLVAAGALAQPAVGLYEVAFVRAGQDPPLS